MMRLWIMLVILGLAPVPIPVPDFHAVRHSHGEGRDCPMHAHLRRWHAADASSGQAVFHVHWALLGGPGPGPADVSRGPVAETDADSTDPLDSERGDEDPDSGFSAPARVHVAKARAFRLAALLAGPAADRARQSAAVAPARNFGTTFPPRNSSASLLQRWVC